MVISFVMLLGVVSSGPAYPAPTGLVQPAATPASVASTALSHGGISASARVRHERTVVRDPFVSPGPRVVIAAAPSDLHDPFATPNVAARYQRTAAAKLRDPFSS